MNMKDTTRFIGATLALGVALAGESHAEVLFGTEYPTEYVAFPEYEPSGGHVDVLGLYFQGYNEFVGSGTYNYYLVGRTDAINQQMRYLYSNHTGDDGIFRFFNEGQSLQGNSLSSQSSLLVGLGGQSEDSPFEIFMAGKPGQQIYIGFTVETEVGPATDINYGFIQLENVNDNQLRFVGWAYETTAGADIVTFSIPSPSSMAFLGLAGVGATRRRRA
mgnify:CR=1 FL=1